MLRNAAKAGPCLGGSALGALTDSERARWKKALNTEFSTGAGWGFLQRAEIASYQAKQRTQQDRTAQHAPQPEHETMGLDPGGHFESRPHAVHRLAPPYGSGISGAA